MKPGTRGIILFTGLTLTLVGQVGGQPPNGLVLCKSGALWSNTVNTNVIAVGVQPLKPPKAPKS